MEYEPFKCKRIVVNFAIISQYNCGLIILAKGTVTGCHPLQSFFERDFSELSLFQSVFQYLSNVIYL